MKKIFALCMALAMVVSTTNAAFTETKAETRAEKKEAYGSFKNAEMKEMAQMFVKMSRKDYEEITGRHLSLVERAAFKIQQKRMKNELKKADGPSEGTLIGLAAGIFLSLIGVLLVYVLSDDANMRKWAWIGAIISFILIGAIII